MVEFAAAVLHDIGRPVTIDRVKIRELGDGDVLLRVHASGLCHSDIELIDGSIRGYPLPLVIGHEGAGVVEALGKDVTQVKVGDHVVCCFAPHCGKCFYCERGLSSICEIFDRQRLRGSLLSGEPRLSFDGGVLHHFSFVSTHAEYSVIPEASAIRIPEGVSFDVACVIGCAVTTGVGAVTQVARIEAGANVAVVGCGVVGLSALQGALISGAEQVIAIDLREERLATARRLGATTTCTSDAPAAIEFVKAATCGRGADYVFEAAGNANAFRLAAEIVRPGGMVVFLGKVDPNQDVAFRWGSLMREKRFIRTSPGGARAREFFPWLAHQYLDGRLKLDEVITQRLPLARINDGYDSMRRGEGLRTVLTR